MEEIMGEKKFGKRISKTSLFSRLKNKADEYLKNSDKLNDLVDRAKEKADSKNKGPLKEVWGSLLAMFRLLRAYAKREYTNVPWQTLILVVATVIYFLIPTDIIPDFIVGLGYLDDAALIGWTMNSIKSDIDDFKEWESKRDAG